ncbi:MAG: acyl-CoA thioesterase [Chlamydiae bacterium]|nr:acyl-CoA thioesterase [Chlamydiota bacterium]MBI3265753.1 acyl-CoA thioesterase [Chlamydiota bacterium]
MTKLLSKKVADSRTLISQLMMPNDANHLGTVHGGVILSIADKVAYVCACRHAGSYCVTASVDRVSFDSPIKVGQLVTFDATLRYVGKTSMEVGIDIYAEDLISKIKTKTNTCYFTMVSIAQNGKPTAVPSLLIETEEEKAKFEEARLRKELSLKYARGKINSLSS